MKCKPKQIIFSIIGLLFILSLFGVSVYFFIPLDSFEVDEVNGTIEHVDWIVYNDPDTIDITVSGITYSTDAFAMSGIGEENAKQFKSGDNVILNYEIGTNEIRALTINGQNYLTVNLYCQEYNRLNRNKGIVTLICTLIFIAIAIYIIRSRLHWRRFISERVKTEKIDPNCSWDDCNTQILYDALQKNEFLKDKVTITEDTITIEFHKYFSVMIGEDYLEYFNTHFHPNTNDAYQFIMELLAEQHAFYENRITLRKKRYLSITKKTLERLKKKKYLKFSRFYTAVKIYADL